MILPATAKWTEEVPTSLDSCPDPTPRGTPLVREVRVPRFTPLILPCFIASKMLLLCQQIIVSCAACTRPLNFLLLYIHFGHLNFPSHCLLSAGQNCEEASAMLSSPSPVSLPFQEVKANKGQEARSQVPDPRAPRAQRGGSACRRRAHVWSKAQKLSSEHFVENREAGNSHTTAWWSSASLPGSSR